MASTENTQLKKRTVLYGTFELVDQTPSTTKSLLPQVRKSVEKQCSNLINYICDLSENFAYTGYEFCESEEDKR